MDWQKVDWQLMMIFIKGKLCHLILYAETTQLVLIDHLEFFDIFTKLVMWEKMTHWWKFSIRTLLYMTRMMTLVIQEIPNHEWSLISLWYSNSTRLNVSNLILCYIEVGMHASV
jgi:hypothetical protein